MPTPRLTRTATQKDRGPAAMLLIGAVLLLGAACGGPGTGARPAAAPAPEAPNRSSLGPQYDAIGLFRRLGLLARGSPMPFVGSVSFFATPGTDSTHVLVAISISNASLTFGRENDRFRAGYTVTISLKNGPDVVKNVEAHEAVVVASFKETSRTDESVLFEEILTVAPGRYDFSVSVRDDGSARTNEDAVALAVPAMMSTGLSTPVSFARVGVRGRLTSLPQVIANPTAGATFGRDTVIPFFIESYGDGAGARPLSYSIRSENGRTIFNDTASLAWRGQLFAGTVSVPISKIGIGAMTLAAWVPGKPDTVRAPLFVGFGADLPLASYEEMINYLRWFAPSYKLQVLRDTAPEFRPAAWTSFMKEYTDQTGQTSAFRDYFTRMLEANTRFREEAMPGWQTDRGKVLLGLGRPDQVFQQVGRSLSQQGRQEIWEYRGQNLALVFYDQNGFGRWRLTTTSESEFMSAWRRRVQ
jgi:GWxTD domain-containing protein